MPFVRWWLGIAYRLGRPLAALGVSPTALTLVGVLVAVGAVPLAAAGGRWPVLAAVVVVVSGLVDNLDGTVAVLSDRITRWGALVDAVGDRVADTAYAVAFWALGAPVWLALAWAGLAFLAEYARARAQVLLGAPVGIVTVGERPTRVVVTTGFLLACGVFESVAGDLARIGPAAGAGAAAVGLGQLLLGVRRRLA